MAHRVTHPEPILNTAPPNHTGVRYGWTCPICGLETGILYGADVDALWYGKLHIRNDHK